ncbi:cucumber peeling cupredoxin [Malania oleifera]|uniref:cucumber peeling cupredoxin n=1 Tax=Malania oleifera TaxID=397392 RepID=UPI0025AE1A9C|nr:cucumber peeling cupredoxin [Malania oleifera]
MEGRLSVVLFVAMAVAALIQGSLAQSGKNHTVGGSTVSGWTVPSDAKAYSTWASSQTFSVGDSLVFNFVTGAHDVTEVTKANYDSCTSTNPISQETTGPATLTLKSTGAHYYICSIPGHCSNGQKLAITVVGSGSGSPAPQPASTPRRASPPAAAAPSPSTTPTTATPPSGSTTPSPSGSTTPSPSGSTTPSPSGSPTTPSSDASPPPSEATPPTPGSPGNAAPSLAAAAGFSATLISVAVALLY